MSESYSEEVKKQKEYTVKFTLPKKVAERFHILECLAENERGGTYLLSDKKDGKWFMLKHYKKTPDVKSAYEAEITRDLKHKGLPGLELEIEDDDSLYVLREYVSGIPLSQYVQESENGRLGDNHAADITAQLCDILTYLHSQPTPIIHRDVNPTNIIFNPDDNSVKLIDFGISRKFSEDSDSDTTYFGTKKYSPPEQYGFAQTDSRTDIYALGVVLRFMLTGSPDGKVVSKALSKVVEKCTAFSPKDRYSNAAALKKGLQKSVRSTARRVFNVAVATLAVCAILAASFYLVRRTDLFSSHNQVAAGHITFIEPLIEEGVREILLKTNGEPILQEDLLAITQLILFDGEIRGYWFLQEGVRDLYTIVHGTINSLEDLPMLPNLREIVLVEQHIRDLSPLADCPMLTKVDLFSAPVTDPSPLTQLPLLQTLTIFNCGISDFSFLEEISTLTTLCIENMPLNSFEEIAALELEFLSVQSTNITTFDGFERFTTCLTVSVGGTRIRDFSLLDDMPNLQALIITADMEPYLETMNREDINIFING